jgi:hypothetical protein
MSKQSRCRVCGNSSKYIRTQSLLDGQVAYYDCSHCGYFQTEEPVWLAKAYASAINDVDTGIMWRNQLNTGRVVMTLWSMGSLGGRVVDHAGGYGVLVRLLRDAGVNASWRDKYCENLLARGFEAGDEPCDLVTAFEVFEHLIDPVSELRAMLAQSPSVLLTTELVPTFEAPRADWWYLGSEHGQHVGFFRMATLAYMARHLQCHWASDGMRLHIFSRQPVPRSWRLAVRWQRLWPLVARIALRPRVLTDFDELRRRKVPR